MSALLFMQGAEGKSETADLVINIPLVRAG